MMLFESVKKRNFFWVLGFCLWAFWSGSKALASADISEREGCQPGENPALVFEGSCLLSGCKFYGSVANRGYCSDCFKGYEEGSSVEEHNKRRLAARMVEGEKARELMMRIAAKAEGLALGADEFVRFSDEFAKLRISEQVGTLIANLGALFTTKQARCLFARRHANLKKSHEEGRTVGYIYSKVSDAWNISGSGEPSYAVCYYNTFAMSEKAPTAETAEAHFEKLRAIRYRAL